MTNSDFEERYLSKIKKGIMTAHVGCGINVAQFNEIAQELAKYIHRIGWTNYVKYIESWKTRIIHKR